MCLRANDWAKHRLATAADPEAGEIAVVERRVVHVERDHLVAGVREADERPAARASAMVEEGQRVGEVGGHRPVGHPGRVVGERERGLPDDILV